MMIFDLVLATRRPELTGIERYGVNLFRAAREIAPNTKAFVLDRSGVDGPGVLPVTGALSGWLELPRLAARESGRQAVTVVCPSYPASPLFRFSKQNLIRIVHDCFPWTRSDSVGWRGRLLFKSIEEMMIDRYDHIAVTTETVQREFAALFRRQTTCCGNAPGLDLARLIPAPVERLMGRPFVLAVGTVEPRKNYDAVLDLVRRWTDAPVMVVIAGRPGWGSIVERLEVEEKANPNLLWLRHATDCEMVWLYGNCSCFLTLSHAEGFNMPLVEAGMSGCPIVCSDLPIHRAVAAPWARFFPLERGHEELIAALKEVGSRARRKEAREYEKRYSWAGIGLRIANLARGV